MSGKQICQLSKRLPRQYANDRKRKIQPYLFDPANVLRLYEIYMRDTPQNEASQASQDKNNNEFNGFHGTKGNSGTCPQASQEGGQSELGRNGTCPGKLKRPIEPCEIVNEFDVGRMGRSESGGIPEKNSQIFKKAKPTDRPLVFTWNLERQRRAAARVKKDLALLKGLEVDL